MAGTANTAGRVWRPAACAALKSPTEPYPALVHGRVVNFFRLPLPKLRFPAADIYVHPR